MVMRDGVGEVMEGGWDGIGSWGALHGIFWHDDHGLWDMGRLFEIVTAYAFVLCTAIDNENSE